MLPLVIDPPLASLSPFWLLDLYRTATPLRVSSADLPDTPLGKPYLRAIITEPTLHVVDVDAFGGTNAPDSLRVRFANDTGAFNWLMAEESRGKLCVAHRFEEDANELQEAVFVGQIASYSYDLHTVDVLFTAMDVARLTDRVPASRITNVRFPFVHDSAAGQFIVFGTGVGLGIDAWLVKWPANPGDPDHYDYLCPSGNFGIEGVALTQNGVTTSYGLANYVNEDGLPAFERLYRNYTDDRGRHVPAVRFHLKGPIDPKNVPTVTIDGQRIYPDVDPDVLWESKWQLGFYDDIGGVHPVPSPTSGLDTSALVDGSSGVGLGAVRLDGIDDDFSIPGANALAVQTFTLEMEVTLRQTPSGTRTLWGGPLCDGTGATLGGWSLVWDAGAVAPVFRMRLGSDTSYTTVVGIALVLNTPTLLTVTRDLASGATALWQDRLLINTHTDGRTIAYDSTGPMRIGRDATATPAWAPITVGFMRLSGVVRDQRYIERAYWLRRRNPVEFVRELRGVELGEAIDAASFDAVTLAVDQVPSGDLAGSLKCDGYVTGGDPAARPPGFSGKEVLAELAPFRRFTYSRTVDDTIAIAIPQPASAATFAFGAGAADTWGNIIAVTGHARTSLAEAVKTLPVIYRLSRRTGNFTGHLAGDVLAVGKEGDALQLSFVYDHRTADIIRDFECKMRRAEDEQLAVQVQHEGRKVKRGDVGRIVLPDRAINADYRVVDVSHQTSVADLMLSPYGATVFDYTPGPLPPDLAPGGFAPDFGNAPGVVLFADGGVAGSETQAMAAANGTQLKIRVALRSFQTLRPTANGDTNAADTVVGAPSHWQAVVDGVIHDGDVSYVEGHAATNLELFRFPAPTAFGIIKAVRLHAVLERTGAAISSTVTAVLKVGGQLFSYPAVWLPAVGAYVHTLTAVTASPATGLPWTFDELAALQTGVNLIGSASSGAQRLTQVFLHIETWNESPDDFSGVSLYRLGPSVTAPPPPAVAATPLVNHTALDGMSDTPPAATAGQSWWYHARARDRLGRGTLVGYAQVQVV